MQRVLVVSTFVLLGLFLSIACSDDTDDGPEDTATSPPASDTTDDAPTDTPEQVACENTVGQVEQIIRDDVLIDGDEVTSTDPLRLCERGHVGTSNGARGGQGRFKIDDHIDTCHMNAGTDIEVLPTSTVAARWLSGSGVCYTSSLTKTQIDVLPFDVTVQMLDPVFVIRSAPDEVIVGVADGLLDVTALGSCQTVGPRFQARVTESGVVQESLDIGDGDQEIIDEFLELAAADRSTLDAGSLDDSPVLLEISDLDEVPVALADPNFGADVVDVADESATVFAEEAVRALFDVWFDAPDKAAVERMGTQEANQALAGEEPTVYFLVGPQDALDVPEAQRAPLFTDPSGTTWALAFRSGDDALANFVRRSVVAGFAGTSTYSDLYQEIFEQEVTESAYAGLGNCGA